MNTINELITGMKNLRNSGPESYKKIKQMFYKNIKLLNFVQTLSQVQELISLLPTENKRKKIKDLIPWGNLVKPNIQELKSFFNGLEKDTINYFIPNFIDKIDDISYGTFAIKHPKLNEDNKHRLEIINENIINKITSADFNSIYLINQFINKIKNDNDSEISSLIIHQIVTKKGIAELNRMLLQCYRTTIKEEIELTLENEILIHFRLYKLNDIAQFVNVCSNLDTKKRVVNKFIKNIDQYSTNEQANFINAIETNSNLIKRIIIAMIESKKITNIESYHELTRNMDDEHIKIINIELLKWHNNSTDFNFEDMQNNISNIIFNEMEKNIDQYPFNDVIKFYSKCRDSNIKVKVENKIIELCNKNDLYRLSMLINSTEANEKQIQSIVSCMVKSGKLNTLENYIEFAIRTDNDHENEIEKIIINELKNNINNYEINDIANFVKKCPNQRVKDIAIQQLSNNINNYSLDDIGKFINAVKLNVTTIQLLLSSIISNGKLDNSANYSDLTKNMDLYHKQEINSLLLKLYSDIEKPLSSTIKKEIEKYTANEFESNCDHFSLTDINQFITLCSDQDIKNRIINHIVINKDKLLHQIYGNNDELNLELMAKIINSLEIHYVGTKNLDQLYKLGLRIVQSGQLNNLKTYIEFSNRLNFPHREKLRDLVAGNISEYDRAQQIQVIAGVAHIVSHGGYDYKKSIEQTHKRFDSIKSKSQVMDTVELSDQIPLQYEYVSSQFNNTTNIITSLKDHGDAFSLMGGWERHAISMHLIRDGDNIQLIYVNRGQRTLATEKMDTNDPAVIAYSLPADQMKAVLPELINQLKTQKREQISQYINVNLSKYKNKILTNQIHKSDQKMGNCSIANSNIAWHFALVSREMKRNPQFSLEIAYKKVQPEYKTMRMEDRATIFCDLIIKPISDEKLNNDALFKIMKKMAVKDKSTPGRECVRFLINRLYEQDPNHLKKFLQDTIPMLSGDDEISRFTRVQWGREIINKLMDEKNLSTDELSQMPTMRELLEGKIEAKSYLEISKKCSEMLKNIEMIRINKDDILMNNFIQVNRELLEKLPPPSKNELVDLYHRLRPIVASIFDAKNQINHINAKIKEFERSLFGRTKKEKAARIKTALLAVPIEERHSIVHATSGAGWKVKEALASHRSIKKQGSHLISEDNINEKKAAKSFQNFKNKFRNIVKPAPKAKSDKTTDPDLNNTSKSQ